MFKLLFKHLYKDSLILKHFFNASYNLDMKNIPTTSFLEILKGTVPFSVMSYNTLANCYVHVSHFPKTPPEQLAFEYRFPRIIKEIASYPTDILCILSLIKKVYKKLKSMNFIRKNLSNLVIPVIGNVRHVKKILMVFLSLI